IGIISSSSHSSSLNRVSNDFREGWPKTGTEIYWIAHIYNNTQNQILNATYEWSVNANTTASGNTVLKKGVNKLEHLYDWDFDKDISLSIEAVLPSGETLKDKRTFRSNALHVGFYIHKDVYNPLNTQLENSSTNLEIWFTNLFQEWNQLLEQYEIKDRLRLDYIRVIENSKAYPLENNSYQEFDADIFWYFYKQGDALGLGELNLSADPTVILHELIHFRGVRDLYTYSIYHEAVNGSKVNIKDYDGTEAVGSERMPYLEPFQPPNGYTLYKSPLGFHNFLMNYPDKNTTIHQLTIEGLNNVAKFRGAYYRDVFGNTINDFDRANEYLTKVPKRTKIILMDDHSDIIADAQVELFFDESPREDYMKLFNNTPKFVTHSDQNGIFLLPASLWTDTSWKKRNWGTTFIIRVSVDDRSKWGYFFLPIFYLNEAFYDGDKEETELLFKVNLR
ncbi:MAG: hypothetical protein AAFO07_33575, partial [Bacteroidota bacterium]